LQAPDQLKGDFGALTEKRKQTKSILLAADKLRWLGNVEAENEKAAITEGAREFKRDPNKLMAVRRS
jgi:hypothetical protein